MLPPAHRLRRADDFRAALGGRKAGSPLVVLHVGRTSAGDEQPARVGFSVSRAVGSAVVRNRVKRRLRHLVRDRLPRLEAGALYVVRATPASATATSGELGAALDRCLSKVGVSNGVSRAGRRDGRSASGAG